MSSSCFPEIRSRSITARTKTKCPSTSPSWSRRRRQASSLDRRGLKFLGRRGILRRENDWLELSVALVPEGGKPDFEFFNPDGSLRTFTATPSDFCGNVQLQPDVPARQQTAFALGDLRRPACPELRLGNAGLVPRRQTTRHRRGPHDRNSRPGHRQAAPLSGSRRGSQSCRLFPRRQMAGHLPTGEAT